MPCQVVSNIKGRNVDLKVKFKLGILFLALMLPMSGIRAQQPQIVDGIAAIVGNEIVLRSEVNQFTLNTALQMGIDLQKNPQKIKELRRQVLENLIVQKILLQKAHEDSIEVDDNQVEQALDNQIKQWTQQMGSKEAVEKYFGGSINKIKRKFREDVKNRMLVDKLQQEQFQKIHISRPEVEQFYKTMKDSLPKRGTSVELSHILLTVKPGKAAKEAAYERISKILKQIKAGADFSEMAKKYSEDPGSAPKGGDLGYVKRGDFVRDFEEAAFKLKAGQISGIVETKFGYHIIQMIDRKGEKIRVRHILIRVLPTQQDELNTVKQIKELYRRAKAGENFAELAKKYSDDKTTRDKGGNLGWFELSQLKVKEFRAVAETLKVGEVSEPFKTKFGYHIIKLDDRKKAGAWSLDKDWEQLEQMALARKRNREFQKWVQTLRKNVYIDVKMKE